MNQLKNKPQAVIFDMDGVIVDSMPYHFLAWYEALRPFGVRVGCFEVYAQEGERWEKTLRGLLKRGHIRPTRRILNKIFALRQRIFRRNFKRYIFHGVDELLGQLKQRGLMLGLVTGSPLAEVERILPSRIKKVFNVIIAGNQVKKGKPHPEPYLAAARALKLDPKACLVIENAPFGITSAKKAGMFCIAVSTSLPEAYLGSADIVISALEEIPKFIPL
jgi:beta-phosphoglucomutase